MNIPGRGVVLIALAILLLVSSSCLRNCNLERIYIKEVPYFYTGDIHEVFMIYMHIHTYFYF